MASSHQGLSNDLSVLLAHKASPPSKSESPRQLLAVVMDKNTDKVSGMAAGSQDREKEPTKDTTMPQSHKGYAIELRIVDKLIRQLKLMVKQVRTRVKGF
jgi:hypothetical protein